MPSPKTLLPFLEYELKAIAEWSNGTERYEAETLLREEYAAVAKRWSKKAWGALFDECTELFSDDDDGGVKFETLSGIVMLINKAVEGGMNVSRAQAAIEYLLDQAYPGKRKASTFKLGTKGTALTVNKSRQGERDERKALMVSYDYKRLLERYAEEVLGLQQEESFGGDPRNFLPALQTLRSPLAQMSGAAAAAALVIAAKQIQDALKESSKAVEPGQKRLVEQLQKSAQLADRGQPLGKVAPTLFTAGGKRRSPRVGANKEANHNTIREGADGNAWISVPDKRGVFHWKKLSTGGSIV